jgi:hypothetical protein
LAGGIRLWCSQWRRFLDDGGSKAETTEIGDRSQGDTPISAPSLNLVYQHVCVCLWRVLACLLVSIGVA